MSCAPSSEISAKTPRFIETVHRRGFRLVGRIGDLAVEVDQVDGPHSDVARTRGRSSDGPKPSIDWRDYWRGLAPVSASWRSSPVRRASARARWSRRSFLASPEVRASPTTVWAASGLCIQQHGYSPEPYMPVLEALDRLARRPDAGDVTRLLRHVAPMWLAQIPWLGDDEVGAAGGATHVAGSGRRPGCCGSSRRSSRA